MMKIKSLYPYFVTDNLAETMKFYTEALDFSVKHNTARADGGRVVILANEAGFQLELMEEVQDDKVTLKAGDHGMRMNVDDIDAARAELEAKGYQIKGKAIETKLGKHLLIADPTGTAITLIQHIHKD